MLIKCNADRTAKKGNFVAQYFGLTKRTELMGNKNTSYLFEGKTVLNTGEKG